MPRATWMLMLGFSLLLSACATVKPSQKEYLSDPAMTYGSGGEADAHEQHVVDNREASFGAGSAKGGKIVGL